MFKFIKCMIRGCQREVVVDGKPQMCSQCKKQAEKKVAKIKKAATEHGFTTGI